MFSSGGIDIQTCVRIVDQQQTILPSLTFCGSLRVKNGGISHGLSAVFHNPHLFNRSSVEILTAKEEWFEYSYETRVTNTFCE